MTRALLALVALVAVVVITGCDSGGGGTVYTYLSTHNLSPGSVLRIDGTTEQVVLTRTADSLTSFVLGGPTVTPPANAADWCYFCDAIDNIRIYRADGSTVYTHTTFVRDLAVGPDNALYFSESYGAGGDGKIYRFNAAGVPSLYYTVSIAQVGFWAGNFAFSPNGSLYIASGNVEDASVYRCPVGGGAPVVVYHRTDGGSIMGFCFTNNTTLLYTDGTSVLRQAAALGGTAAVTVFTSPGANQLRDVVQSSTEYPIAP